MISSSCSCTENEPRSRSLWGATTKGTSKGIACDKTLLKHSPQQSPIFSLSTQSLTSPPDTAGLWVSCEKNKSHGYSVLCHRNIALLKCRCQFTKFSGQHCRNVGYAYMLLGIRAFLPLHLRVQQFLNNSNQPRIYHQTFRCNFLTSKSV